MNTLKTVNYIHPVDPKIKRKLKTTWQKQTQFPLKEKHKEFLKDERFSFVLPDNFYKSFSLIEMHHSYLH